MVRRIDNKGYVLVDGRNHKFSKPKKNGLIHEHRVNVENYIKRRLKKGEVIHHINLNKQDNRIENLIVFKSPKEHSAFHNKIKKFPYLTNPMKRQIENRWNKI